MNYRQSPYLYSLTPVQIISTSVWIISTHCMNYHHSIIAGGLHAIIFKPIFLKYYQSLDSDELIKTTHMPKQQFGTICFSIGYFVEFW